MILEDFEDNEENPVEIPKNAQTKEDHNNLEIDNNDNNNENEAVNQEENITDNSPSEKNIIGKFTRHIYQMRSTYLDLSSAATIKRWDQKNSKYIEINCPSVVG